MFIQHGLSWLKKLKAPKAGIMQRLFWHFFVNSEAKKTQLYYETSKTRFYKPSAARFELTKKQKIIRNTIFFAFFQKKKR